MAITFDDLPANRNVKIDELIESTNIIFHGLNRRQIKVIGLTKEVREARDSLLNVHGYQVAPVTYDTDDYYLGYGVSWLDRWAYSNGLKVDWNNESEPEFSDSTTSISSLENDYSKKIGVYAVDTNTGEVFSHRANERFPMQSTFKLLAASYLLKESETNPSLLNKKVVITENDMVPWHPITGKYLPNGKMSLKDLAQAAMSYSDNPATNLIMKEMGGPKVLTQFANSIGNDSFTLMHYEAKLNSPDSNLKCNLYSTEI